MALLGNPRCLVRFAIGFLIGLVFEVSLSAEPILEGRVRLPSGVPVPGAQVLLFDLADLRAAPAAATTDRSGGFILPLASLSGVLPERFVLGANYPNPFNPTTMIPYQLPTAMYVRLEVFNILGQRIATLVDGEQPAGFHTASWDATDAAGRAVGAGVYLYRLRGGGVQLTRSMLLIDGQAGIPPGEGGQTGLVSKPGAGPDGETAPAYGLTVSAPGLVPYVDPAFRMEAGMAPLNLVIEASGRVSPAKGASTGAILGDVDNTGRVDFVDALLVAVYSIDATIAMPNNGDISLGDVDVDGKVDHSDAWLISAYLTDPSHPILPTGIGEPVVVSIPDLIVESVSLSDSTLRTGQSFTLSATIRNQGTVQSAATTLRWFRSDDATISTRDLQIGIGQVSALAASDSIAESIRRAAPSSEGTYYYGACVRPVAGEADTQNNCSAAVTLSVARGFSLSSDRDALVALYEATDGPNWTNNTNWLSDKPVGNWHGVTVSSGRVTGLELPENQLTGSIPSELGNLTNLGSLALGYNQLTGPIPPQLGQLTSLWQLHLPGAGLTGGDTARTGTAHQAGIPDPLGKQFDR